MSPNYTEMAREIAFSQLKKTNKMLIVNDKDDEFFSSFYNKYKVCHISLVGSVFESIPYTKSYSVTNLGLYVKTVYEDCALNSPVDVLYIDLSRSFDYLNYLDEVIDENTVIILKYKNNIFESQLPDFIKRLHPDLDNSIIKFGDWDSDHKYNSEYYLLVN